MKLGLIPFFSGLHEQTGLESAHQALLADLKQNFDVSFLPPTDADAVDLPVIFVGSGGVEGEFKQRFAELPEPLLLLADGLHNSLAASLEIAAWVRSQGREVEILHGSPAYLKQRITTRWELKCLQKRLRQTLIGVLGEPSPWLIASIINDKNVQATWGCSFQSFGIGDILESLKAIREAEAQELANRLSHQARAIQEPTSQDLLASARFFLGLKQFASAKGLQALTLRCFDLLPINFTGCLALALLNDNGITAGCEGDCPAVFSMHLLRLLTGQAAFMANPSAIDTEKNRVIFSHCTVPLQGLHSYSLRSHFESGLGVSIQGLYPVGPVTIFRCGGEKLDRFFVSDGMLEENLNSPHRCRTQVQVTLVESVDYFLFHPLANHHLLVPGHHARRVRELFRLIAPWAANIDPQR
jgi:L-fucose isomerase-like protein